jgi:hypothetical protein
MSCRGLQEERERKCKYEGGIYDQQDATNSQYLLLEMLYMFRTIIAHHQELGTLCAAVRCYVIPNGCSSIQFPFDVMVLDARCTVP